MRRNFSATFHTSTNSSNTQSRDSSSRMRERMSVNCGHSSNIDMTTFNSPPGLEEKKDCGNNLFDVHWSPEFSKLTKILAISMPPSQACLPLWIMFLTSFLQAPFIGDEGDNCRDADSHFDHRADELPKVFSCKLRVLVLHRCLRLVLLGARLQRWSYIGPSDAPPQKTSNSPNGALLVPYRKRQ